MDSLPSESPGKSQAREVAEPKTPGNWDLSQLSALHPHGSQKIIACTCQASGTACGRDWDYEKETNFRFSGMALGLVAFSCLYLVWAGGAGSVACAEGWPRVLVSLAGSL